MRRSSPALLRHDRTAVVLAVMGDSLKQPKGRRPAAELNPLGSIENSSTGLGVQYYLRYHA